MFQNSIIANDSIINNFFKDLKFDLYLTKPQLAHMKNIVIATYADGFKGKANDVSKFISPRHRTSVTRFLSSNSWDETLLFDSLKGKVVDLIWNRSKQSRKPIYVILDDTISEKTKPSSKALNTIEKCSYHHSHLSGKVVYGHQIVACLLSCDGLILPYSIEVYDKTIMSKIDIASHMIKSLPAPVLKGYVLCDSWYSCKSIFKASIDAGYSYVGGLKTNRVIYPKGTGSLGAKLNKHALSLNVNAYDLVTVRGKEYYIHHYVGKLNDMKKASIVLSYPKDVFQVPGCLKSFISLDLEIPATEILDIYSDRWAIEPFFRDCKSFLGLNGYQVRSHKSILRYLISMLISYTLSKLQSGVLLNFNEGYKRIKTIFKKDQIRKIYIAVKKGASLSKIFEDLKIA